MDAEVLHLSHESVHDESNRVWWAALNSLLNYMVSILVFDAFDDVVFQFVDQSRLLVCQNMFNGLVQLVSNREQISRSLKMIHAPFVQLCNRTFAARG